MTFAFKWQTRKGLDQVSDKEVHVSMRYKVHRVLWQNICDGHQRSPGRCPVSSSHPWCLACAHVWPLRQGQPWSPDLETWRAPGMIGNIIRATHISPSITVSRAGCHLENSWGPDTGVTPSSLVVSDVMWSDQWSSRIIILSNTYDTMYSVFSNP